MEISRPPQFGCLLRRFREAAVLSQEELAERAGLSARGISDLERGARSNPHLETVRLLAQGLNLNERERAELIAARNANRRAESHVNQSRRPGVPVPVTSFIGREHEIETITHLLKNDHARHVTLVGPGGVGKTRIAIEVAHRLANTWSHGATFVDLAAVQEPDMVMSAIADQLGVPGQPNTSIRDALAVALHDRSMLIVIDNLEQVIDSAADIAWLLTVCADLTVLATSRVVVHIAAEHVMPIEPMPTPAHDDVEALAQVDAVSLFVERARAVDPQFVVNDANAAVVASIIVRLEGLPLAIELAAARVRLLSLEELQRRLQLQLPYLTGGVRDAPHRQRTMRDTIAWSYALLTPAEQAVLRTLAVFPQGCTLDTGVAVLAVSSDLSAGEVLAAMESLVDSSLLRRRDGLDGQVRYRMLQTVREYGLEQLRALGEEEDVRLHAHSQWAIPLAQNATFVHLRPNLIPTLNLLAAESQNLSEHVSWLRNHGLVHDALEISGSLASFRGLHGHFDEARSETGALLLEPANGAPSVTRAKALVGMGIVGLLSDDTAGSIAMLQDAEAVARQVDAPELLWMALYFQAVNLVYASRIEEAKPLIEAAREIAARGNYPAHITHQPALLATISQRLGDWDSAFTHMQEAVRLAKQNDLTWFETQFSRRLGFYYSRRGEFDLAEKLVAQAERLNQELHSLCEIPHVQVMRGIIACRKGDPVEMRVMAEKALASSREIGSIGGVTGSLILLGHVALIDNHPTEALGILLEAIEWSERCGEVFDLVQSLDYLGDVAVALQEPARAAWFVGAADNIVERNGIVREELVRGEHERLLRALNNLISETEFAAQYERGRSMTLEEILAELRAWEPKVPDDLPA